jgi:hypothetical protein
MTDQDNNILYSEALSAAEHEALELDQEIAQLRKLLHSLELRKTAVDEVCSALGRWVDLAGGPTKSPEDEFDSIFEGQGATIRLSEEEVSLIAYPDGPPDESTR